MQKQKQLAALPFIIVNEKPKILLITSRDTGRWVLPKGWPEEGVSAHNQARTEAFEEAGVKGKISSRHVGKYNYMKRMKKGKDIPCCVSVFPLQVTKQVLNWPERDERQLKWFSPKKAAKLVDEQDLASLLINFQPRSLKVAS